MIWTRCWCTTPIDGDIERMIAAALTARRTGGLCVIRCCGQLERDGETLRVTMRGVRH
jgi:hypothetical protein